MALLGCLPRDSASHVSNIKSVFKHFDTLGDMEEYSKGVRLYGEQVREWSSPPPASPGIFYSSYEFPASENGKLERLSF